MDSFLKSGKTLSSSFYIQLNALRIVGLWPSDDIINSKSITKKLYILYSYCFRTIFLYLYTFFQILYFTQVTNIYEISNGLYLLMTQLALILKVIRFGKCQPRVRELLGILDSTLFYPQNNDELVPIKTSMFRSRFLSIWFLVSASATCSIWAIFPLLDEGDENRLPIVAWYPLDMKQPKNFIFIYIYQVIGVYISALYNVALDTIASALMVHATGQIDRLGMKLTKLGHIKGNEKFSQHSFRKIDQQMATINNRIEEIRRDKGSDYGDIVNCIIFHSQIINYVNEIENIFSNLIFAQFSASVVIICMTGFQLLIVSAKSLQFFSMICYLNVMVVQILLYCWVGNDLKYSSQKLNEKAAMANFQQFNKSTTKILLMFMQRTKNDINVKAGNVFKITLSLQTFVKVMKSSYSFFAVLQTMQANRED